MNNGLMIDAIFALVLVLGVVLGAKRGLFRSFMALAAILVALIGASLLTDALTGPVTEALMPRAEKSVQEWFDAAGHSPAPEGTEPQEEQPGEGANIASPAPETASDESSPLAVTGLLKKLLHFDLDGAVRRSLRSAAQEAALTAVRTLLGSVVRTIVFLLCFLVLSLLLRLVIAVVDKALGLPVLNTLNTVGGGLFGLAQSALLLFLVCDLAPKLGFKAFSAYEGTYLLSFFMSQTPRGVLSALLP